MTKLFLEKVVKELKLVRVVVRSRYWLGGHGDSWTKLFGGHKPCYDGRWPLTVILKAVTPVLVSHIISNVTVAFNKGYPQNYFSQ